MILPRYIYGDSPDGHRSFIIRTEAPGFIAELFEYGRSPPEGLVAVLGGDYGEMGNFVWFGDGAVSTDEILKISREVRDVLEEYDFRLGIDIEEKE